MNKIIRSLITISLFISVAVSQAKADVVPAGLNPGDHYQLAFVTSTTTDATSADISDYNTFVNAAANLPGSLVSGATFYAIASTPTVNANSNAAMSIATNFKGVYNLNGFKIADNIYSGSLQALLNYDETGKQTSFNRAWTGSIAEGVSYIGYSLGESITDSVTGLPSESSSEWMSTGGSPVGDLYPLYALSGDLTVTATPEPSTYLLLGISLGAVGFVRKRMGKQC